MLVPPMDRPGLGAVKLTALVTSIPKQNKLQFELTSTVI